MHQLPHRSLNAGQLVVVGHVTPYDTADPPPVNDTTRSRCYSAPFPYPHQRRISRECVNLFASNFPQLDRQDRVLSKRVYPQPCIGMLHHTLPTFVILDHTPISPFVSHLLEPMAGQILANCDESRYKPHHRHGAIEATGTVYQPNVFGSWCLRKKKRQQTAVKRLACVKNVKAAKISVQKSVPAVRCAWLLCCAILLISIFNCFPLGFAMDLPMQHALRRSMLLIRGQPESSDRLQDILFDTAIKYTHTGFRVLFFTQKPLERVANTIREQFSDLFKMITFIYVQTIDAALTRLLDLQRWTNCIPGLIIVESFDLLTTSNATDTQYKQDFQRVLFLSTLADTVRTISINQKGTCNCIVTTFDHGSTMATVPIELFYREHNVLDLNAATESSDILSVMMENEHSIDNNLP